MNDEEKTNKRRKITNDENFMIGHVEENDEETNCHLTHILVLKDQHNPRIDHLSVGLVERFSSTIIL